MNTTNLYLVFNNFEKTFYDASDEVLIQCINEFGEGFKKFILERKRMFYIKKHPMILRLRMLLEQQEQKGK